MGCGCKTNINGDSNSISILGNNIVVDGMASPNEKHRTKTYLRYTFNFLVFSLSLFLLPIIVIGAIVIMFKVLVLNDTLDMGKIAKIVANKIRFANYDEEELDYLYGDLPEYEDEEEVEYENLYEIEDLNEKNKNVE